jgi:Fe-S-cluster containining protein
VFLTKHDLQTLACANGLANEAFTAAYCRWVDYGPEKRLSLKEKTNGDCVFWKEGCAVYTSRPLQCRTYPFWPAALETPENWKTFTADCPGTHNGTRRTLAYIERQLSRQAASQYLTQPYHTTETNYAK